MTKRSVSLFLLVLATLLTAGTLWAARVPSRGKVNCTALNVREGPGMNFTVLGTISNGDEVTILGVSGSWYQVNTGGYQGKWVYSGYIDVLDYAEVDDRDASNHPYPTLLSTDPTRPEIQPKEVEPLTAPDF